MVHKVAALETIQLSVLAEEVRKGRREHVVRRRLRFQPTTVSTSWNIPGCDGCDTPNGIEKLPCMSADGCIDGASTYIGSGGRGFMGAWRGIIGSVGFTSSAFVGRETSSFTGLREGSERTAVGLSFPYFSLRFISIPYHPPTRQLVTLAGIADKTTIVLRARTHPVLNASHRGPLGYLMIAAFISRTTTMLASVLVAPGTLGSSRSRFTIHAAPVDPTSFLGIVRPHESMLKLSDYE